MEQLVRMDTTYRYLALWTFLSHSLRMTCVTNVTVMTIYTFPNQKIIPSRVPHVKFCDACSNYPEHRLRANQACDAMKADTARMEIDDNLLVMSVDLQKAITMPKILTKEHFFSRKVIIFNETFACPKKDGPIVCVLWHEAEAGRKAFNITSASLSFIHHNRDKEEIIMYMYCDNCGSQNKCWDTLLSTCMNREWPTIGNT